MGLKDIVFSPTYTSKTNQSTHIYTPNHFQPTPTLLFLYRNTCASQPIPLFILQVAQCMSSPVTCTTTAVRSDFKHTYHVFGQQEALFPGVHLARDLILIARFYLRRRAEVGGGLTDVYDLQVWIFFKKMFAWPSIYDIGSKIKGS